MPPNQLPPEFEAHQPAIEEALQSAFSLPKDSQLPLYLMMRYQLGWVDQTGDPSPHHVDRVLGAFCAEAASSLEASAVAVSGAAAIELLGESIQTHEDMQSGSQQRGGRDAVWWIWGPAQAINVGDGLHALARLSLFNTGSESLSGEEKLVAIAQLDDTALQYYEGQYLDLLLQERIDVTVQQYLRMARGKYGSLIGGAMTLGAIFARADENTMIHWRAAGEALGIASLMASDYMVFWGNQSNMARALNKSKLYPVVVALEEGSIAQRRELGGYYFKRVMEPSDLDGIRSVLETTGAKARTEEAIAASIEKGLLSLRDAGVGTNGIASWRSIAESVVMQR